MFKLRAFGMFSAELQVNKIIVRIDYPFLFFWILTTMLISSSTDVTNVSGHLSAAKKDTRERTYQMFSLVDKDLGARIAEATEKLAPAPGSKAAGSAESRL